MIKWDYDRLRHTRRKGGGVFFWELQRIGLGSSFRRRTLLGRAGLWGISRSPFH